MGKEITTHIQEVQRVPYNISSRRNTLGHILIKLSKIFKKYIKSIKEKAINNIQGTPPTPTNKVVS